MLSELKEDGYAKMKRRIENRGVMEKVDAKMDLLKDRAPEEYIYAMIFLKCNFLNLLATSVVAVIHSLKNIEPND